MWKAESAVNRSTDDSWRASTSYKVFSKFFSISESPVLTSDFGKSAYWTTGLAGAAVFVAGVSGTAAAGFGFSVFWTSASAGLAAASAGAEVAGLVSSGLVSSGLVSSVLVSTIFFVYAPSFWCASFEIDAYFDSAPSF